jgi:hypothetical protein
MSGSNYGKNAGSGQSLKTLLGSRANAIRDRLSRGRISALEQLGQSRERLEKTRQRLEKARRRLEKKDRKISALQARLDIASGEDRTPVFFVVGMGKSGTGWLMKLLDAHPEVLCKGEGKFFGQEWTEQTMKRIETDTVRTANRPPGSLYAAVTDSEALRFWIERSVWARNADPDERLNRLAGLAVEHFLRDRLHRTGKRMAGDKTPLQSPDVIRETSLSNPDAKVIHIVRDGRDQAVSMMHQMWKGAQDQGGSYPLQPEEQAKRDEFYRTRRVPLEVDGGGIYTEERLGSFAERWKERVGQTVEDGPALLGDRYAEVKYEDLLDRPVEEARRLFGYLGADTGEEVVRRCVEETSFEALSGRERGGEDYGLDFKKYRKGIAGDWENVFTERDKAVYKEVAGELLIKLGYARDNDW